MNNLEKAKMLLKDGDFTCVLCSGDVVYSSHKSGIVPMLDFIGDGIDLKGFSVADKIVGKAVAMLFAYAGISEAYAEVMSVSAVKYLESHGIMCSYSTLTEAIINRQGNGLCPMEQTVSTIEKPTEALCAIKNKLTELRGI